MGYPRGLIRYTTENALENGLAVRAMWKRVLRPRTLVYASVLIAMTAVAAVSLATRIPLRVDIIRDRGALARETAPGRIENVYRVQLMNTDESARRYSIAASGLPGLEVVGVAQPIELKAASTRLLAVRLQAPLDAVSGTPPAAGPHRIELTVRAVDDDKVVRHEQSTFIVPR
jgi:polyferredoxin